MIYFGSSNYNNSSDRTRPLLTCVMRWSFAKATVGTSKIYFSSIRGNGPIIQCKLLDM